MTSLHNSPAAFDHLKPRYSFNRVCNIFGVHENTLRNWLLEGVPAAEGRKIKLHCIRIGVRKTEFEQDEVERVYLAMKAAS